MRDQFQWTANRGYIQHIEALKKINSRQIPIHKHHNSLRHRITEPLSNLPQNMGSESKLVRNCESSTIREKKILWQNYLLGKRIIQTHPVICKKKLDEDFREHKRILDCMTSSSTRKLKNNQFRIKKLQEYKEEIDQNEGIVQNIPNSNLVKIIINTIAFYRHRPALDNLSLHFSYLKKNNKNHVQASEKIPVQQIYQKPFLFTIPKRLATDRYALTIQMRNVKGLNQYSIGYFSFPSCEALDKHECQLFHAGKPIGEVLVSTTYTHKSSSGLKTVQ